MLTILKKKHIISNPLLNANNTNKNKKSSLNITEKPNITMQIILNKKEYKNTIYHPSSTKEWFNSVYSYNKLYTKSLINTGVTLNKLFQSYFNMLGDKIKFSFKRRRTNKSRYSANKIYLSRPEIKHTNTKLTILLYIYNKQKLSIEKYINKIVKLATPEKQLVKDKIEGVITRRIQDVMINRNRLISMFKNKVFIFKKWKTVFFKKSDNIKYLVSSFNKKHAKMFNIPTYNNKLWKKNLNFLLTVSNYADLINFNKSKFSNLVLNLTSLGIISLIEKVCNNKILVKLVELKSIHLNSDVFSLAVALKLRDRKNKAIRVLGKAILQMVKIPSLHTLITIDHDIFTSNENSIIDINKNKTLNLNKNNTLTMNLNDSFMYENNTLTMNENASIYMNENNILNSLKQQVVSGVRFEASGRLTRRLTAMRAIFKYRYTGSLKDIRSSYNNESSTLLRGYVKSNLQYTIINSKTRNGSFAIKGWVSSHYMFFHQTLISPLDQFEIRNLFSIDTPLLANIHLSMTNIGLYLTIASFLSFTISILARNYARISSNEWSLTQESSLGFKKDGLKFFAFFVPAGCPLGLLPLLVLIEIISYLASNVSLGLKLVANILSHNIIYIHIILLFIIPVYLELNNIGVLLYFSLIVLNISFIYGLPEFLDDNRIFSIESNVWPLFFYTLSDVSDYILQNSILYGTDLTNISVFFFILGLSLMMVDNLLYKKAISFKQEIIKSWEFLKNNWFSSLVIFFLLVILINGLCTLFGIVLVQHSFIHCFIFFFGRLAMIKFFISISLFLINRDSSVWYENMRLSIYVFITLVFYSVFYFYIYIPFNLWVTPNINWYYKYICNIHFFNSILAKLGSYVTSICKAWGMFQPVQCSSSELAGQYFAGQYFAGTSTRIENLSTIQPESPNVDFNKMDALLAQLKNNKELLTDVSVDRLNDEIAQNTAELRQNISYTINTFNPQFFRLCGFFQYLSTIDGFEQELSPVMNKHIDLTGKDNHKPSANLQQSDPVKYYKNSIKYANRVNQTNNEIFMNWKRFLANTNLIEQVQKDKIRTAIQNAQKTAYNIKKADIDVFTRNMQKSEILKELYKTK